LRRCTARSFCQLSSGAATLPLKLIGKILPHSVCSAWPNGPRTQPKRALTVTPWPKTAKKKFTKTPYSWPPMVLNGRLNLAHSFEKMKIAIAFLDTAATSTDPVPTKAGLRNHKGRAKETENSRTIERLW
jgi:hypothetical protein